MRPFAVAIFAVVLFPRIAFAGQYIPGIPCEMVGSIATGIAIDRGTGHPLDQELAEMRESASPGDPSERPLEVMIRSIYLLPAFQSASPEEVGQAYERTCLIFEAQ